MNELTRRLRPWFGALLVALAFAAYWFVKPAKPTESALFMSNSKAVDTPQRDLQFENAWVRVWKTTLRKGEVIDFRYHAGPRVVVPLNAGKITKVHKNGERVVVDLKRGEAYWLEADPAGTEAQDMVESSQNLELMVVELQPEVLKAWTYYKQEKMED